MDFRTLVSSIKHSLWAVVTSAFVFSPYTSADVLTDIKQLEKQFHEVSGASYKSMVSENVECHDRFNSLKELNSATVKLQKLNKNTLGVCLIENNIDLVKSKIDSKDVFVVFKYLLENNYRTLADELFIVAKQDGDKSLISNISYIYAQYYEKRKDWNHVLQLISNNYNDLAFEDANHARIMAGVALQKTKKHRDAVQLYLKIPENSTYYAAASLNVATAYLRQDWWTDAHLKINEIISNKKIKIHAEMINRLHLVLGYSLLQKEYYRDSREAFRNVEINSQYSNKALLGIALTATSQEDFISALNAINILKKSNKLDLSVDESYLLLPYIHEKLKQNVAASASYNAAQEYYRSRIHDINSKIVENTISRDISEVVINDDLVINNNVIKYTDEYPLSFIEIYNTIKNIKQYTKNTTNNLIKNNISVLSKRYEDVSKIMIRTLLNKRIEQLNNYMNQSRYGMARLIDKNSSENNI